jgi:hypothetical protein
MKDTHPAKLAALMLLLLFLALPLPCMAAADASPETLVADNPETFPLQVRSSEEDGLLGAEVFGVIEYPFSRTKEALTSPAAWCEFLPLVFNVKSCIHRVRDDRTLLTLFIGRKFFEPPEDALQLEYDFHVFEQEEDLLSILLFASEGPHGTRDYLIEIEAHASSDGRTSLRLNTSFRPSLRSNLATQVYLSTIGRGKVGFSMTGTEGDAPVYVGGTKGIIERNAMRYYFALKAYLDTLGIPEETRFDARLNAWFDLTQEHPRQLYEMSKREYLSTKRKERRYQLELQGSTNQFQVNRNERRVHAVQG